VLTGTKGLNIIKVFDKNNKLINGATIIIGDLVSIKCYVGYWKHFISKQHEITSQLVVVKK
jgi:hypothetical protein